MRSLCSWNADGILNSSGSRELVRYRRIEKRGYGAEGLNIHSQFRALFKSVSILRLPILFLGVFTRRTRGGGSGRKKWKKGGITYTFSRNSLLCVSTDRAQSRLLTIYPTLPGRDQVYEKGAGRCIIAIVVHIFEPARCHSFRVPRRYACAIDSVAVQNCDDKSREKKKPVWK